MKSRRYLTRVHASSRYWPRPAQELPALYRGPWVGVVLGFRQIENDPAVGSCMTRLAWCVAFIAMALVAMRQSALLAAKLAEKYSWPLIEQWHSCWDIEHCSVSWWGQAAIVLFLAGPAVAWASAEWKYSRQPTAGRFAWTMLSLLAGTALFYLGYYALIW